MFQKRRVSLLTLTVKQPVGLHCSQIKRGCMKGGTTTSRPQNCRLIIPAMVKIPALALEGQPRIQWPGHHLSPSLCIYCLTNQIPVLNMLLGPLAAEPDELVVCFDFTLGKASGLEQPAHKPAWGPLRPLSGVAYSVQAFDWSGGKCKGQERDSGQDFITLLRNQL